MAQATLPRLDRTAKAAGIITRHEVIPVDTNAQGAPGFYQVRDTGTGSGKVYLTSLDTCSCPDATFRGNVCKHMTAARIEHQALEAYAADWDAIAQPSCPMCGSPMVETSYYTGGRGYQFFEVCSGDASHTRRAR